ncbi:hypothetical protein STEG23_006827 [Scotinomys teguina]
MSTNVQAQHHQMAAEVAVPYITRTSRRARSSGVHHMDITRISRRAHGSSRGSGTLQQRSGILQENIWIYLGMGNRTDFTNGLEIGGDRKRRESGD